MSNTYLQDFGLLRKQANAQEVNDPMSGSGRWEDLQMDLRKPHIPKPRRDNVPANRSLTVGGVTIGLKANVSGEVTTALGFVSKGSYKHRLVTPKAHTYRRAMTEAGKPDQRLWVEPREPKYMSIRDGIRFHIRKVRFGRSPARSLETVRLLWPLRNSR
jgi:hypothetical protein